ncbi:SGNH/GDSL hydrolase family protein [Tenggerimyces flavus]|uniref:SGNH/GDSL hydrolase family protein n=1 Tax=Tenggerimyces flavus TaxID=1708749 RepID=A0ABV7YEG2_9ACTN|nr:SGNH/GDSL hydrolase family protein [Tenggerimyces flavus]MBM7787949.1 lysophospholipase L1-like esterase [Tenggerimyces flavus]
MRRLALAAAAAVLLVGATALPAEAYGWTTAWTASQQPAFAGFEGPNWSVEGFANHSVRQVVRVTATGPLVRIRLSNAYGSKPLEVAGATIARTDQGATVDKRSLRRLTFGGRPATTIAQGRETASDPALLPVKALDKLTVTLYLREPSGPATFHELGLAPTYRANGDHRFDAGGGAFTETTNSTYFLTGVDVLAARQHGTVVLLGDSITDGYGTTSGADNRYPDELAERIARSPQRHKLAVANAGISGDLLLTDVPCFADSARTRFGRDVLAQPDVRTVVVHIGINDIGTGGLDLGCAQPPVATARALIAAHRSLIRAAHARGIEVIGTTILPMKGTPMYDTVEHEAVRDSFNHWVRTSGMYDAVVDFDQVLRDPTNLDALLPAYDSGDHLHPSDAGAHAMAKAIKLSSL